MELTVLYIVDVVNLDRAIHGAKYGTPKHASAKTTNQCIIRFDVSGAVADVVWQEPAVAQEPTMRLVYARKIIGVYSSF